MKQSVISYVPMAERYDVLVLGGGTAGVMAACAAGREGKKALILEREYALGGTATLSLTVPRMTNHIPGFVSNSSLAEELQQTLEAKKEGGDTYFCDPQMQKVELEAMCAQYGVAILYGAELGFRRQDGKADRRGDCLDARRPAWLSGGLFCGLHRRRVPGTPKRLQNRMRL